MTTVLNLYQEYFCRMAVGSLAFEYSTQDWDDNISKVWFTTSQNIRVYETGECL